MPRMRVLPSLVVVTGLLTALKLLTLTEAALADEKTAVATMGTAAAQSKTVDAAGPVDASVRPIDAPVRAPDPSPSTPASVPAHPATIAPSPAAGVAVPSRVEPLSEDLRARSAELDRRSAALDSEEAALTVARDEVQKRLTELETLKATLASMERDRETHSEQDWAGLVKIYEAMRPANAAAIFDLLDTRVLIQVLDRMNDRKAAPVLAAMLPERARLATQLLAQMRLKDDAPAKGLLAGRS